MKKYIFPTLIALSALSVSLSAAFYSVFGLSKLFAGASLEVMIMAGSLEAAKLVIASLLYQYWSEINKLLRAYLVIATIVLITITSGGIYGFLSGAYQETATQSEFLEKEVAILQHKKERYENRSGQLRETITTTTTALSNPTMIQYVDGETGQLITTTSSRVRKMLQAELAETKTSLEIATDSITSLDLQILSQQIDNEAARELGPLKYMAKLTGYGMDVIVNWFMILIIFVFDPLAIAMVVSANIAFTQIKPKVKMSVPHGMKFNTPYPTAGPSPELRQRVKDNQAKLTNSIKLQDKDLIVDDLEDQYTDTEIQKLRKDLNDNNIMSYNQGSK